uniref:Uncharacterized protein n=1 Tax=Rhizophora mucronata TaxID=61149 RepID=A0A2P2LVV6_RHIMU
MHVYYVHFASLQIQDLHAMWHKMKLNYPIILRVNCFFN